jgi:hypothetical protein
MKWTVLAAALMMLICITASGQWATYPGTDYLNPAYPDNIYIDPSTYIDGPDSQDVAFSTTTSDGAPVPTSPSSAESLGITIPSDVTSSQQAPTAQENTQIVMRSTQDAAYSSAPKGAKATATSPVYNKMIVPPGGPAPNQLYVFYAPRTVASCNLYAHLPLWMSTSRAGTIWFYEWYPSGMLDTQYAGYVSVPDWYKRWFYADTPGWHILQYHCAGWSNYVYIYVQGYGNYWVNPNPMPNPQTPSYPYWDSPITYTYPPTGHTYYTYSWSYSTDKPRKGTGK